MPPHRNRIIVEQAKVLAQQSFSGQQYVLKLYAPRIAKAARPGQFIHLRCDDELLMRRPYSIMSASIDGTLELLYKIVGKGSHHLATKKIDDYLNCLGPIGQGFQPKQERPVLLSIGGGVGIPPIFFLAQNTYDSDIYKPIVMMGSEIGFPFETTASSLPFSGCASDINLTMRKLEQLAVPARLASKQEVDGCYEGYLDSLAKSWLEETDISHSEIELFACGPQAMLKSIAQLAVHYDLPCQLALEEYMACAVGGCAGCTVAVKQNGEMAMRRVCVDGPVFPANEVFFELFE